MVGATGSKGLSIAAQRRSALAGKDGLVSNLTSAPRTINDKHPCQAGLIENKRVFGMAVFASLGGLLYGERS